MDPRTLPEGLVPAWFEAGLFALEDFLEPRPLPEADAVLWTVVLVGSALDVVTTIVGVGRGIPEGNAVARAFMATYGTPGIGALKLIALLFLVVVWYYLEGESARLVLMGFALVTLLVSALNTLTLAGL
ncbi:DUF5658 family protein [Halorhabdus amylolytica]|uniref:DUF5658 family protein n=1 Tax=Halorhabdus amylolytica TaxID=2559573 RepID=UPI0010AA0CD8|nr:DUF5658 family protein [Halorhabdus amylolytica]